MFQFEYQQQYGAGYAFESLNPLPGESEMAYEAFVRYIFMGAGTRRSLKALSQLIYEEREAKNKTHPQNRPYKRNSQSAMNRQLSTWSKQYNWQGRLMAYITEHTQLTNAQMRETWDAYLSTIAQQAGQISAHLQAMIDDFTTRRYRAVSTHQDPDNPNRSIRVIHEKVNVGDLEKLVRAFGTFNRELRMAYGLPQVVEVQGEGGIITVKGYVNVTPDDWDDDIPLALPAPDMTE